MTENERKKNVKLMRAFIAYREDLIIAAYGKARENLKKKSSEELSKVTGGINLPLDFKLPF